MGTLHFSEQFEKRYGLIHPEFFTGTFDEAIRESCLKPAKEVNGLLFSYTYVEEKLFDSR